MAEQVDRIGGPLFRRRHVVEEPGGVVGAEAVDEQHRRCAAGIARRLQFEVAHPLGAGDGDDVVTLGEHPGERELAGRAALGGRDLAHLLDSWEQRCASHAATLGVIAGKRNFGEPVPVSTGEDHWKPEIFVDR